MNIYLIYSKNDSSVATLKSIISSDHNIIEIFVDGFDKILKDFKDGCEIGLGITFNEAFNHLVYKIIDLNLTKWKLNNPDLVCLEKELNNFEIGEYIRKWKKCEVIIIGVPEENE